MSSVLIKEFAWYLISLVLTPAYDIMFSRYFPLFAVDADHNLSETCTDISVNELMKDCSHEKTVIKLQLLQIVSGSNDGCNQEQSRFTYYSRIKKNKAFPLTVECFCFVSYCHVLAKLFTSLKVEA